MGGDRRPTTADLLHRIEAGRARRYVGFALSQDAELERRANRDIVAHADRSVEIIDRRLVEVRPGGDCSQLLAAWPRADLLPAAAFIHPGGACHVSPVQSPC